MANQIVLSRESYEVKEAVEYLWVYNLSCATTTQEIVNYFEELVGPIEFFTMYPDDNADCLGKVEIVFRCPLDARKALLLYDGTQLHGRQMVLKLVVDGCQIYPEQIVFPGSVIRLPVVSEQRLLSDDITRDFSNDINLDESSKDETERFLPQEQYLPPVELIGKSQYHPALEQDPPSDIFGQNYICLFVSNLPYSISGQQLLDFFEETVGPVESIGMYLDDNGFLCGKAQISFRNPEDSYKALLCCDGTPFDGRTIILKLYVNGQRVHTHQIFLPELTSADDWLRPHVPFVSLPSPDCMAEYFPDEPILGPFTMPTIKEGVDQRNIHPQGPDYPPFLPLVFVKDCIRPYVPPAFE